VTSKRTRRIIAVFGGSKAEEDILALAENLGRAIAEEKQILLTGGTGPDRDSVKNRAICGVGSSPWVGVDRKKQAPAEWSRKSERGFVVTSDLDHKRNYLEALMCDAAIVLEGEQGTRSEVTSSLSLQRPVAFVGDHWKDVCVGLDADRSRTLDSLLDVTLARFAESLGDNHALDSRLTREELRDGLSGELRYKCFGSEARATDIVRWIESVLPDGEEFPGTFPVEVHEAVATPYEEWLIVHGAS
jgi:predicted Rossmann-fold nucleotide-binding protein